MNRKLLVLPLLLVLCQLPIHAEVRLPNLFADHMVLQRNKPIPVWGWADPGERIAVSLTGESGNTKPLMVRTGKDGKWRVDLPAMEAGGPYQLVVKGKQNALLLQDVLIGEVWICSGQSNMAWPVNASDNAAYERENANYPSIRHITIPLVVSLQEEQDIKKAPWLVASSETVGGFSAVAYFFARELFNELNVPIGLINTSWGGTQVESWISREGIDSFDEFTGIVSKLPESIEELNEIRKKMLLERIQAAQGNLPSAGETTRFSEDTFDDSQWKTLRLPTLFDTQELPNFDGVIWFRKTFDDTKLEPEAPSFLSLGANTNITEVFINGIKVGETHEKSSSPHYYPIPTGVLKSGKNSIALRVTDEKGRAGFIGRDDQMLLIQPKAQLLLSGEWKYCVEALFDNGQFVGPNHAATLLYNAMVAPLVPYAFQGAIWYQGESNAGRAVQYRKSFPLLIQDWRKKWGEEFPFLYVQLASYRAQGGNSEKGSSWAELREAQTMTLKLPKTGMAVTNDIGQHDDIHPRNKQDVGKRLALNALTIAYDKKLVYSGPQFRGMKKEGNALAVEFDHVGSGLVVQADKYGYLKGFEVAGADQKFHWAKAEINGDKVIVWADEVVDPVAVRYGWADDHIEANLFNAEGLPANSFRSDDWKPLTDGVQFK